MTELTINGNDEPIIGLSKLINPRKDSRYSANLWRFLTYKNKYYTNVFQDPTDGNYFIGLRNSEGIFVGAKLKDVFCQGNNAFTFSFPISITRCWNEVTTWYWGNYIKEGKALYNMPNYKEIKPSNTP